jgi:hypothetical protein
MKGFMRVIKNLFHDLRTFFVPKKWTPRRVSRKDYIASFEGREKRAFACAMEARRFEIQMYWTRTAYFWTLSAAALTGFFISFNKVDKLYTFVISCIGFILSLGWALANKGSKYWHENWENHVQMLEDSVVGPLHKTLLYRQDEARRLRFDFVSQVLTGPSGFSVSKINSIFSWFFVMIWVFLGYTILPMSGFGSNYVVQWRYVFAVIMTILFAFVLFRFGRSWVRDQTHLARIFRESIAPVDGVEKDDG